MTLKPQRRYDPAFPSDRPDVCVDLVMNMSYVRHQTFNSGELKAILVVRFADLAASEQPQQPWHGALIHLHLRSGAVFGLRATGGIDQVIVQLEEIAVQLHARGADDSCWDQMAAEWNGGLVACTISMLRDAPVCPDDELFHEINRQYGSRSVRDFLASHSHELSDSRKQALDDHFSDLFSERNPDVIAFKNGLDRALMNELARLASCLPHGADKLNAYNWLAQVDSPTRARRVQALLMLPWLAPVMLNVSPMRARLDKLSTDPLPFRRWDPARQALVNAIDAGTALTAAVATILNLPEEIIDWSCRQTFHQRSMFSYDQVDMLLRVLSWLPSTSRPNTETEYENLTHDLACFVHLIGSSMRIPDFLVLFYGTMRTTGARFVSCAHEQILIRWFRTGSQDLRAELSAATGPVPTFLSALSDTLRDELRARTRNRRHVNQMHEAIMNGLLERSTLNELVQATRCWQRQIPAMDPRDAFSNDRLWEQLNEACAPDNPEPSAAPAQPRKDSLT